MADWKTAAEESFFRDHKSIQEISEETGISRQSISAYLKALPGYRKERERRKTENAARRKDYKTQWNREHRMAYAMKVTPETMKREHEIAAMLLSHER